jgi:hypothetical protein
VLSMGGFFTLMAVGLASRLPAAMQSGLTALGVHSAAAQTISRTPPVGTLFAAFLGDNPIAQLMRSVDPAQLRAGGGADVATLTGRTFFPHLIADAFHHGLVVAFSASIALLAIAVVASALRGSRYVHAEEPREPHQSVLQATVREAAAVESPNLPGADLAYEQAVHQQPSASR